MAEYAYQKKTDQAAHTPQVQQADPVRFHPIPNSLFMTQNDRADSNLGAVMRERAAALQHQIPAAEREADRLSHGITAATPDGVRQQMGKKLGADFSNIRMYTDAFAANKADRMGAKAYTEGQNVYFGSGGFEPEVAAHELVHTVQQGAAEGTGVQQSVSFGTVQMCPNKSNKNPHGWGKLKTLNKHFKKHGKDVQAKNPDDYAEIARQLYNNRAQYQVKIDRNKTVRVYDAARNLFGAYNANGTTRTMFSPTDGQEYFDRQSDEYQQIRKTKKPEPWYKRRY